MTAQTPTYSLANTKPPYGSTSLPTRYNNNLVLTSFNNPNTTAFPGTSTTERNNYRNRIGYRSYVQFMMDFGRDLKVGTPSSGTTPTWARYVPTSVLAPDCPRHTETVAGRTYSFPPREMPMHACRRALIAAINTVRTQNAGVPTGQGDRVSLISFDRKLPTASISGTLVKSLTGDFYSVMDSVVDFQSASDNGYTTTPIKPGTGSPTLEPSGSWRPRSSEREQSDRVADRRCTKRCSNATNRQRQLCQRFAVGDTLDFYKNGAWWLEAPLVRASQMAANKWKVFPVGIGLGTDYDFMDRFARIAGTAQGGLSVRGSGNPATMKIASPRSLVTSSPIHECDL